MKRMLNTLYVTTQGAYLRREGEALLVRVEKETRLRVPVGALDGIVAFGRVSASPGAMQLCGERGVPISFLSERGRFMARVEGRLGGNVLLRREQYRRADCPQGAAEIARSVVAAKAHNSRHVLMRAARDRPGAPQAAALARSAARIKPLQSELASPAPLARLRGVEGHAAQIYFDAFGSLLAPGCGFAFAGRSRRPPLDPVNALLSFVYTLLVHDAASALCGAGLDPAVGFLHRDRPGRPGLALDVMEEFRACLADRLVLSLVNQRQVRPSGFRTAEAGAVHMDEGTRKTVLVAWQKRKQEEIRHPFLEETVPAGLLLHCQALLLARRLRGDLDAYPAFFWK